MKSLRTLTLDKSALIHNVTALKKLLPAKTKFCAVIKADAYGHGISFAAKTLAPHVDYFAVATNAEALELFSVLKKDYYDKPHAQTRPILVLSHFHSADAKACIVNGIEFTVSSISQLNTLSYLAKEFNTTVKIHIKINSGMNRFGVDRITEFKKMLLMFKHEPLLNFTGLYTHFGSADEVCSNRTKLQIETFNKFLAVMPPGLSPVIHAANTAAALNYPQTAFGLVRIGIGLYGYVPDITHLSKGVSYALSPFKHTAANGDHDKPQHLLIHTIKNPIASSGNFTKQSLQSAKRQINFKDKINKTNFINLKPVLTLKTKITQIRTLKKDTYIGYGENAKAAHPARIAVVPLGYADGISRALSNKGYFLINGQKAKIISNVCMDSAILDITGLKSVRLGSDAVFIGKSGSLTQTASDIAAIQGTIPYEVLTSINKRRFSVVSK